MNAQAPIRLLLVAEARALRPQFAAPAFAAEAGEWPRHGAAAFDGVLLNAATPQALAALSARDDLAQLAFDCAVVVATPLHDAALEAGLLRQGVEAIAAPDPALARAVQHAVERKRVERSARTAYATDLATGLPHETQLLEHMTQLIALRERQPGPMALIVLRIEGYAQAAARLGGEAGNVLRRKVAVRLRSGLRASDVVAALGPESFGVLLGHLEAKADGGRVAAKLVRALLQPIVVAGEPCAVAASVGLAIYPDHGRDAPTLLQRAAGQAGSVAMQGSGEVARASQHGALDGAANDEPADDGDEA